MATLLSTARQRAILMGCIVACVLYLMVILPDLLLAYRPPIQVKLSKDGKAGKYRVLPPPLAQHFPGPDAVRKDYHEWNDQSIRELHVCMAMDTCGTNQRKIALLAAHWFEEAIVRGWRGGEGVWALSVYRHLRALGYTTVFANSFEEAVTLYRMFPSLVTVVIRNKAGECHSDPVNCVKSEQNPTGIPAWKIFDFEYFPSPNAGHFHASLMKGKWILSAHPERGVVGDGESAIQFIGFSVEDQCTRRRYIPLSQRENRVFLLMKQLTYVYDQRSAWNRSDIPLAASELDISFTGAWLVNQHYQWNPDKDGVMQDIEGERIINLLSTRNDASRANAMGPEEWAAELGKSKAMLGMGNPWWSPSPYHALCAGVPFINPILNYDSQDPWNKTKWHAQHPSLVPYDRPYVYHVHNHNYTGFVDALRAASTTEITPFIPGYMRESAVRRRVQRLMEHDWKEEARKVLEERQKEGKGYIFQL